MMRYRRPEEASQPLDRSDQAGKDAEHEMRAVARFNRRCYRLLPLLWRPRGGAAIQANIRGQLLDERVGDDPTPGGGLRGHIGLKKTIPAAAVNSVLMVLQHPLRSELQFAIGTALGPNESGSRLRHTASTQGGSSGSPVLDAALAPMGLHNGTRPRTPRSTQEFNTAVPLAHIVADLASAGITEMLQE